MIGMAVGGTLLTVDNLAVKAPGAVIIGVTGVIGYGMKKKAMDEVRKNNNH